jgi:hypothetical protein
MEVGLQEVISALRVGLGRMTGSSETIYQWVGMR